MDGSGAAHTALHYLHTFGPVVLAAALFLSGLGVPAPASLLVIAAGALAGQGRISGWSAFLFAVAGAVAGSLGSYEMGRRGLERVLARLRKGKSWRRAERRFRKRAVSAVILTRFLLTPLALPINLIAGGEKYPRLAFAWQCAIGNALYVLLYGGLGYVFSDSWRWVAQNAGKWGLWAIVGVAALYGLYEIWTHYRGHYPAPPGPEAAQNSA